MNAGTTPTVLVVGGSGIIGQALSKRFAERRWRADIHIRTHVDSTLSRVHSIIQSHGQAETFHSNVAQQESVDTMMEHLLKKWRGLDVLVYAVRTNLDRFTLRLHPDEWASLIHTNLTDAFHFLKTVAKVIYDKGQGSIIIIGSLSSAGRTRPEGLCCQ